MSKGCQLELQSSGWLHGGSADRPSFQAMIARGLSGPRAFQVFAMPNGLLFLELRKQGGGCGSPNTGAMVTGALLGGAIGAVIGGMLTSGDSTSPEWEPGLDRRSEDELYELARVRKRSFVAKNDEILSVSIDAPGFFSRTCGDGKLAGFITLRDRVLGKVKMEIRDQSALGLALDVLPRRLGDRVHANVELNPKTMRFVRKRG